MTEATTDAALRDLLLPGIVAMEHLLGMERCADLIVDDAGLRLEIKRGGREKTYPLANRAEIDGGEYKVALRAREAFADFLSGEGVRGVREYLERRGPRAEGVEA